MKRNAVKTTCAVVASTMILSLTGCSDLPFGNNTDDIIDAGESFASAAASCSLSKMSKVSAEDFDKDTEDWEELLDFSEGDTYDSYSADFNKAVSKTIAYEIDEDSAEIKKDKASVNVVFTIADYESILKDDSYIDIDSMIDALDDADTEEIEATIEFEKQDDDWVVTNYEEIMKDLYEFTDTTEIEFDMVINLTDPEIEEIAVETEAPEETVAPTSGGSSSSSSSEAGADSDISFYGATFIGCSEVDYDLHTGKAYSDQDSFGISQSYSSASGNADFTGYSIVAEHNGEVVETVQDDITIVLYSEDGVFDPGDYVITFYDATGNAFWTGTITVIGYVA